MRHKHRFVGLCVVLFLALSSFAACGPSAAQPDPSPAPITPEELDAIGQQELEAHIRRMPIEAGICVQAEQERTRFTLGQPYELYRLRSGSKRALEPGMQLETLIIPANQWEFPVLIDNRVRCQMTAAFFEGRWQVVGVGSLTPLQILIDYQAQHPELGTPRLIEFAPESAPFALFNAGHDEKLLILWPNSFYFEEIGADRTYSVDELLPNIITAMNERGVR